MPCCSISANAEASIDADIDQCMDSLRALAHTLKADSNQRYNQSRYTKTNDGTDEFLDMKEQIVGRLTTVRSMLEHVPVRNAAKKKKEDQAVVEARFTRALQAHQSVIRTNVRHLNEEFRELERTYKEQNARRRKKYSEAEADSRRMMVEHLAREIEQIKTDQMRQYMKDYKPANFNTPSMADSEIFSSPKVLSGSPGSFHKGGGDVSAFFDEDVNAGQKQSLLTIQERAAAFDVAIDDIGAGVEDLFILAAAQNEEVKKQNLMLENMAENVDNVAKKMGYINKRMKRTLKEVGRAGDKLCVDIFCVVLAVGLFAVVYNQMKLGDDLFGG